MVCDLLQTLIGVSVEAQAMEVLHNCAFTQHKSALYHIFFIDTISVP